MEHGGKYHRAEQKLSRVVCLSIHSKYKFTQLTQFERTSRGASRSYLLPVHRSTTVQLHRRRIVHQSSDQVCVLRHNIVVLSLHFAPSLSLDSSFSRRGRESFRIHYQCDSFFSFPLLLYLSIFVELPFFVLSQLFRHRPFYSFLRIPILFFLFIYTLWR